MADIAVLGAAGPTGLAVVSALTRQGHQVTGVLRRREQTERVVGAGATRAPVADLGDPSSLPEVLGGHDAAYLLAPTFHPEETTLLGGAVHAAGVAGVPRVVLHSVLHPYTPTMRHHLRKAAAEDLVRRSELDWVILQPAMYMQNALTYLAVSPPGEYVSPFALDAPFSVVDLADVAAVAARALTDPALTHGTFEVCGDRWLSMRDMAAELAALRDAVLEPRAVSPTALPTPAGWSTGMMADFLCMCAEYDDQGLVGNAAVTRFLLGRDPTSFATAMRRELGVRQPEASLAPAAR